MLNALVNFNIPISKLLKNNLNDKKISKEKLKLF